MPPAGMGTLSPLRRKIKGARGHAGNTDVSTETVAAFSLDGGERGAAPVCIQKVFFVTAGVPVTALLGR